MVWEALSPDLDRRISAWHLRRHLRRRNDYLGYYSGDNGTAANRPQLVITYQ